MSVGGVGFSLGSARLDIRGVALAQTGQIARRDCPSVTLADADIHAVLRAEEDPQFTRRDSKVVGDFGGGERLRHNMTLSIMWELACPHPDM